MRTSQAYVVLVSGKLAPGQMDTFKSLFTPLVRCSSRSRPRLAARVPGSQAVRAGACARTHSRAGAVRAVPPCLQAAHVAQHEDGCTAYELSIAEDDPDRLLIYERWGKALLLHAPAARRGPTAHSHPT